MIFHKNQLLNETLDTHFETWMHTLNTADYVPKRYLKFIDKVIYDNLKKKLKEVDIYNLLYLQSLGYQITIFDKLKIYFSGLKPLFDKEYMSVIASEQNEVADNTEVESEQCTELEAEADIDLEAEANQIN